MTTPAQGDARSASRQRDPRAELNRFWDSNRPYYEQAVSTNPEAAPERRFLFSHLAGDELLLDLGAGACDNAVWLPAGVRYVGLDVSTVGFALARELGRPGAFVRSDGASVPLATGSVDAVLSTWAIEHFLDPGRTLAEAARVLVPDGLLLLVGSSWDLPWAIPPSLHPGRRLEIARRRLARQLRSLVDGHHRFDTVAEPRVLTEGFVPDADAVHVTQSFFVCRYLEACGMEIVEHRSLPHRTVVSPLQRAFRAVAGLLPIWRHGWGNILVVARRGPEARRPHYELREL